MEEMNRALLITLSIIFVGGCASPSPKSITRNHNNEIIDHVSDTETMSCEIHHVSLEIGYAPVQYGLLNNKSDYLKIKKELFPYADDPVNEGCIVGPWKKARVKVCYKCKSAYRVWMRAQEINTQNN